MASKLKPLLQTRFCKAASPFSRSRNPPSAPNAVKSGCSKRLLTLTVIIGDIQRYCARAMRGTMRDLCAVLCAGVQGGGAKYILELLCANYTRIYAPTFVAKGLRRIYYARTARTSYLPIYYTRPEFYYARTMRDDCCAMRVVGLLYAVRDPLRAYAA